MKNSKIIPIIKNEIEKNVKSKWFIILNTILLIITVAATNYSTISSMLKSKNVSISKKTIIYVIDNDNLTDNSIITAFENDDNVTVEKKVDTTEYENDSIDPNTIIVKIEKDSKQYIKADVVSKESISSYYIDIITTEVTKIRDEMFAEDKKLTIEEISIIESDAVINRIMIGVNSENADQKEFIKIASTYVIFFILLLCLNKIASTISQEKMSKSIEYILTSISAKEYMISKVVSMCMIVVLQFLFAIIFSVIGIMINTILNAYFIGVNTLGATSGIEIGSFIDLNIVLYFVIVIVFMIITTFILGMIQSVMSAKTTNIQEAGNATIVLVMLNLALYTVTTMLISPVKAPTIVAYIISVLPIASMYFIPSMFIIGQATMLQVLISFVVLCGSIPLILKYVQKPFRNAILDYAPKKNKKIEGIEKIISTRKYQERIIERKESSKKGFIIGLSVSLLIIIQLIGGLIISVISDPIHEKVSRFISSDNLYLVFSCIVMIISVIIPYFMLRTYSKEEKPDNKDKKSIIECMKYIILSIPIISCIQMICSFAVEKMGIGANITEKLGMFEYSGILATILIFIEIAIIPAIVEELFIRKGVIGILKEKGAIFAVFVSSIVFAIIHLNLSQFIFAFLIGILFGVIRVRTNRLFPTIVLHFINNAFAVVSALFYNNIAFMNFFTYFCIILNAVGFSILIFELYKKVMELKDKEAIEKLKDTFDYRKLKINIIENSYVFKDFTLIVTSILAITLFIAIEKILTII